MKTNLRFCSRAIIVVFVVLSILVHVACAEETFLRLGRFDYDRIVQNGAEPLDWIQFDETSDSIVLICRHTIAEMSMHNVTENEEWPDTSLRGWLNEEFFFSAFNDEERENIVERDGDLVSLMSEEEVYANPHLSIIGEREYPLTLKKREIHPDNTWWTKTRSTYEDRECIYVYVSKGYVDVYNGMIRANYGIRPVIAVKKSYLAHMQNKETEPSVELEENIDIALPDWLSSSDEAEGQYVEINEESLLPDWLIDE